MPNSLQTLDTAFPKIDDHQTTEENFNQVTNYLYMLLENLRYTLGNLGEDNFNDTELDSIAKLIQEPIWARIADDEGNIHTLNVTAQNLLSQISDMNGNLTTLQQTASTLSSRISDTEGDISTLTQTANSLSSRISDAEGDISTLTQTANGLSSRISDTEGDISTLTQTASSLSAKVSDVEGNISTLTQTANSLSSQISDVEGDISTLTQTASSLNSRISDAEGNISSLQQTASSLSTKVSNVEGSISTLQQTVNGFSLSVSNGTSSSTIKLLSGSTTISSQTIQFTGGVVFKSDLSTAGSTTINGSNITTGTITSNYLRLYGNMTVYTTSSLSAYGGYIGYTTSANDGSKGIHMGYSTTSGDVVATANGAKLVYGSSSNQIYISNGGAGIYVGGTQTIYTTSSNIQTNVPLLSTNKSTLGNASFLWGQLYTTTSPSVTSDANQKNSVQNLSEKYLTLFDGLIPRRYKLDDGTSDRYHVGFIAQEVEEAMTAAGVDSQEFGGFVKDTDENTDEDIYFLRYEEFIAILAAKISALETRIHTLEETA